jgi:hypothetical protein
MCCAACVGVCSVLEGKLAEARSKKDTLKARAASAKTSKQIQEMVGSLNTNNSVVAFDKMEEKVRRSAAAWGEWDCLVTGFVWWHQGHGRWLCCSNGVELQRDSSLGWHGDGLLGWLG